MKVQNFSENLEKNLARLGHEVSKNLGSAERDNVSEREIVKQSLKYLVETENDSANVQSSAVPVQVDAPVADNFLPEYLSENNDMGIKKSLEHLLQITAEEDIIKAVREARKYPPFIEDAFHDALVDKFLPELKKRGIIK